jgi:hypothetical protein
MLPAEAEAEADSSMLKELTEGNSSPRTVQVSESLSVRVWYLGVHSVASASVPRRLITRV